MKPTDVQNLREAYASMQEDKAGGHKKTDTKDDWANSPRLQFLVNLKGSVEKSTVLRGKRDRFIVMKSL